MGRLKYTKKCVYLRQNRWKQAKIGQNLAFFMLKHMFGWYLHRVGRVTPTAVTIRKMVSGPFPWKNCCYHRPWTNSNPRWRGRSSRSRRSRTAETRTSTSIWGFQAVQTDSSCPVLSRWWCCQWWWWCEDENGDGDNNVGDDDCDSNANDFRYYFLLDTSMSPTPKKS